MERSKDHETIAQLLDSLKNAKRAYRDEATDEILRRPELLPALIYSVFEVGSKNSVKAAWVLELVCLYEPKLLIEQVDQIATGLNLLSDESAIRPISKVVSILSAEYMKEPWEAFDPETAWINSFVSESFKWLQEEHKIAAKVFAMESLFIWGNKIPWIHDELIPILDEAYGSGSPGYRSRAGKIMDKI